MKLGVIKTHLFQQKIKEKKQCIKHFVIKLANLNHTF